MTKLGSKLSESIAKEGQQNNAVLTDLKSK